MGLVPSFLWTSIGGGRSGKISHSYPLILFDYTVSAENLFKAWDRFRRGKRARLDVQVFERRLEENIFELLADLKNGSYRHGGYEPFIVHDPKRRQIHKATVRDRIVHQLAFSAIEPLFDLSFIYDSFSCRTGKGTHAGVRRLQQFLRQASHNNTRNVYALKCDIKQFFASIDHEKLLNLLSIKITDEKMLALLREIIGSFSVSPGKGIPLGNLTSQLFANVYMHQFDWFVKHQLSEKYYVRYCDDFVIAGPNRQHLESLVVSASDFLATQLRLEVHPQKITIRKWNQGIDFLGYILKPHCVLLRNKTKKRVLKKVNSDNLPSYLGLCSHADSYELQQLIRTVAGNT